MPATRTATHPSENSPVMSSVTAPSSDQPTTSLIAAALIAIEPGRSFASPVSAKIRPSTGSAVIDIDTAKISVNAISSGRGAGSAA
jgi:hypothetical protein